MGRWSAVAVVCLMSALAFAGGGQPLQGTAFTKGSEGKLPVGWKIDKTGKGEAGLWKVVADASAPSKTGFVLAQTSAGVKSIFNLCVLETGNFKDVEVRVAFKAVKGELDQGGGIVWRYQDADHYYIARMNPLEDNYRFYKVVGGVRKQLATREGLKAETGTWHTLMIRQVGEQVQCFLDGKVYLEHSDSEFARGGKVGLWTKADAQTYFDQFDVKSLDK